MMPRKTNIWERNIEAKSYAMLVLDFEMTSIINVPG
jgi:hypothetical protein